jgi:hypothetical protein
MRGRERKRLCVMLASVVNYIYYMVSWKTTWLEPRDKVAVPCTRRDWQRTRKSRRRAESDVNGMVGEGSTASRPSDPSPGRRAFPTSCDLCQAAMHPVQDVPGRVLHGCPFRHRCSPSAMSVNARHQENEQHRSRRQRDYVMTSRRGQDGGEQLDASLQVKTKPFVDGVCCPCPVLRLQDAGS